MVRAATIIFLPVILLLNGCATHYLQFTIKTEPHEITIRRVTDDSLVPQPYSRAITPADKAAGRIVFSEWILETPGHFPRSFKPPPIPLDDAFWKNSQRKPDGIYHGYLNMEIIRLKRDPNYIGPKKQNKLEITIHSNPPGAAVYRKNKFYGIAPLKLTFALKDEHYKSGRLAFAPLTVRLGGYLPKDLRIPPRAIKPDWRYRSNHIFTSAPITARLDPDPSKAGRSAGRRPSLSNAVNRHWRLFQNEIGNIKDEHMIERLACYKQYLLALGNLAMKLQKAGDLDGWEITTHERKRAESSREVTNDALAKQPIALRTLQLMYRRSLDKADANKARKIVDLASRCSEAMDIMKKKLTQSGQVENAMKAREGARKIESAPEVIAARAILQKAH